MKAGIEQDQREYGNHYASEIKELIEGSNYYDIVLIIALAKKYKKAYKEINNEA